MSDETKPDAPASSPGPAPGAGAAPTGTAATTAPLPSMSEAVGSSRPSPALALGSSPKLDWTGMIPEDTSSLVFDVVKAGIFFLVIANVIGLSRGTGVTGAVAAVSALGALAALALWKAYKVVVESFGLRAIGVTYGVLGAVLGVTTFVFASSSGSVQESRELRMLIGLVGLLFLYPAGLGIYAAVKGEELEGANPLGVPFQRSWFSTLWILYSKEVRGFFTTAVPYLVFFVFMLLNGILCYALIHYLTQPGGNPPTPSQIIYNNILFWLSLWIICPAITMRLVAEERRMGTIETLLTAPVTDIQVILSKFLAAFTVYAVMMSSLLVYLAFFSAYSKEWDWGPIFSAQLGVALVGGLYLSIGLFWSTLTQSQMIAFIFAATTCLALWIGQLLQSFVKEEKIREVVKYLTMTEHYHELLIGVVTTRSLMFFGSLILLFLFCSVRGLETQKWK